GADFTPVTGVLTFNPEQTSLTFIVPISSSLTLAGQKTVRLSLGAPSGAALGPQAAATLIIVSPAGFIQFAAATFTVPAAAGRAIVTVDRVNGASGAVTVSYAAVAGSAIPGVDFTPVTGTLTFPAVVSQATVVVPLPAASQDPYDATVVVSLGSPTGGAGLG